METAWGRQAVGQPPQLPGVCGGGKGSSDRHLSDRLSRDATLVNQYRALVRFQVLL